MTRLAPATTELLPRLGEPQNQIYQRSYREFVRQAQALRPIDEAAVVLVAALAYSWMPRTLRLGSDLDLAAAANILEAARRSEALTAHSFEGLATALGGSPVAASKLLHFFHPELYPIWDSRVWRALDWHSAEVRANAGRRYLDYVGLVRSIIGQPDFHEVHHHVERTIGYPVSRVRALELLLFLSGQLDHEE
jgi:hypothetical protein